MATKRGPKTYPGTCRICKEPLTKRTATKHLLTHCNPGADSTGFLILAEGTRRKEYWILMICDEDATLENIDAFLRDIWVECCGHLSSFTIYDRTFESSNEDEKSDFDVSLNEILEEGSVFSYLYDYGDTTYLTLKVMGSGNYTQSSRNASVNLLARNDSPEVICHTCENEAAWLCTNCEGEKGWVMCDECKEDHPCGDDMLLPIVNSPRVGQCGYDTKT
ncbi:MAG: hypothetical protein NT074_01400 [Methanomicrobiales archaeon]|nr:hypothetical protein [Methanomicrobiales archaeon]